MSLNFNNLNSPKMQKLIAAAGIETEEDAGRNIDAVEHNWNSPQCFDRNQLGELESAIKGGMEDVEKRFSNFFHSEFEIKPGAGLQHFANSIVEKITTSEKPKYFLGFTDGDGAACGFIQMPVKTAASLAGRLLGESGSDEDAEEKIERLSQLEESLLIDIASILVRVIGDIDEKIVLKPAEEVAFKNLPMQFGEQEELFEVPLKIKGAELEGSHKAKVIILCRCLSPIVTAEAEGESVEMSPEEASNAILGHLKTAQVELMAKFATVQVSLDEVMDLKAGDIMLLDKKINEPVEVVLENKSVFKAECACDNGEYALVITEKCGAI